MRLNYLRHSKYRNEECSVIYIDVAYSLMSHETRCLEKQCGWWDTCPQRVIILQVGGEEGLVDLPNALLVLKLGSKNRDYEGCMNFS